MYGLLPSGPTSLLHLLLGHPAPTALCCLVLAAWLYLAPIGAETYATCCQASVDRGDGYYCTEPSGTAEWFFESISCAVPPTSPRGQ
mgnify:CR=1 FL=1